MKIDSSAIKMNSTRSYDSIETTIVKSRQTHWALANPNENEDKLTKENPLSKFANDTKKLLEDQNAATAGSENRQQPQTPTITVSAPSVNSNSSISDMAQQFKNSDISILREMLALLLKNKEGSSMKSFSLSESIKMSSQSLSLSFSQGRIPSGQWVRTTQAEHFFSEHESTTFSSTGIAKTEDGRELAFNIDLQMSRSFMEYTNVSWEEEVIMTDPLVINLDSNPTSLSDQKFFFDIDSDGKEEEISHLNKGSGYLALDTDGNGKIDNGSELFGAKTGNGFAELAAYDTDKNGWIDENDEIFNKLKVWVKNADNTDQLINLKDADIGAIYLGNTSTDFTLKSAETGQVNGQVRRTGMYLKESTGMAQTVQQIDLAI